MCLFTWAHHFSIDCHSLTDNDIAVCARLLAIRLRLFSNVEPIPPGGDRLAEAMKPYANKMIDRTLLCDDVITSATSLAAMTEHHSRLASDTVGCAIFACCPVPYWITPLFTMSRPSLATETHRRP
jgi:hypothetical protein